MDLIKPRNSSNWGPGFYQNGLGGYSAAGSGIATDGTILHPYSRAALLGFFLNTKV
jgi:hypothetical protein